MVARGRHKTSTRLATDDKAMAEKPEAVRQLKTERIEVVSLEQAGEPVTTVGCCGELEAEFIDGSRAAALAAAFKAIGNPVRLQILDILRRQAGQVCVCDIESRFNLSQPTISHHLRALRKAGLVDSEQRGTWIYYFVREESLAPLRAFLTRLHSAAYNQWSSE